MNAALRRALLAVCTTLILSAAAQAQTPWPAKPVKILVPTAPGGTADNTARMLAQHMNKVTGQQFYVENRGGAGNVLGVEQVARSPNDGTTLLLGAGTIAMNHVVYRKLPYDLMKDLVPVTQMVSVPNMLLVHPSLPVKTLAEFIALAKAKPGQITYGSAGVGSNLHLAMELLKFRAGIDLVHVPYKGVTPALQDTLAGHVVSMISNVPSGKPHVDAGKLRAIAVTSRTRVAVMPDLPTFSEAGIKDYEVLNWFGLFAPAGTPQPIIDRLQQEAAAMFAEKETKDRLAAEGAEPVASKPADFAAFVRDEVKKWDEVGKAANIQPTE
ncbi:MAG: tripartite tricarboxylate transporter substrate binding protein [Pseudomonadota bacterium]